MRLFTLLSLLTIGTMSQAQTLVEGLQQSYEVQASVSSGSTPLWLNANCYGLSSLQSANGYVRGAVERPLAVDSLRRWGVGYGLDLALPYHYTSKVILQQAFVDLRCSRIVLTLGQKQQPMAFHHQRLSSGAQTLGINARPVPGVRLEVPDYWSIPGTKGWLSARGHIFYGCQTDDSFQRDWTNTEHRYVEGVLFHTKAGYLRIGPSEEGRRYNLELGLEMACQNGGTLYNTSQGTIRGTRGWRALWNAFTAGGNDESDPTYHNVGGNQLGSWVARFNADWSAWGLSLYGDHYFEDHSSMFLLDYDGYGTGDNWNSHDSSRFLFYPLRDMMWGAEVRLYRTPWLKTLVMEWLDTRYQSGPIYHDHNSALSDHIGGDDNYYNHYLYHGWSHWGQVMGNPLYRSPLYNEDNTLTVESNRFTAFHLGMEGELYTAHGSRAMLTKLDYRVLATTQRSLGTYQKPFASPRHNFSMLAEVTASFSESSYLSHCALRTSLGFDAGRLLGNNFGLQFTFIYRVL